jgi:demethylmenaquinone methyltransferase/2-methoxy-6-polyprenyl-1,4-benzoquinol methylase
VVGRGDPGGSSAVERERGAGALAGDESERRRFLTWLFDETAPGYERSIALMSLGSGTWYRRRALRRHGLQRGMTVLDVAVGTGAVARAAGRLVAPGTVVGLDPSFGMLAQARRTLAISLVQGVAERLPFRTGVFDFVSMGYALRHVAGLRPTLSEYFRVLKPGGTLLILEFARPRSPLGVRVASAYFNRVLPAMCRLGAAGQGTDILWRYCWDTVERSTPPATIVSAMAECGFRDARDISWLGLLSEYVGRKAVT